VDFQPDLLVGSETQRPLQVLSFILAQTGGKSGFLFDVRPDGIALLAPDGRAEAPEHVVDQVRRDIQAFRRNRRRASTELESAKLTMLTFGTAVTPTVMRSKEHDYRTLILSVDDEEVLAAAAIQAGEGYQTLSESLLRSLAHGLSSRNDDATEAGLQEAHEETAGV
jgi:hypothetical protein